MSVHLNPIQSANTPSTSQAQAQPRPALRPLPIRLADNGKVRLGAQGPVFRGSAIKDSGKVRLGAQGPIFR